MTIRVKICGITDATQGQKILHLGADALGFICVPQSPRFIQPDAIAHIVKMLPTQTWQGQPVRTIGVFANASLDTIQHTLAISHLNGIQLHGNESVDLCQHIKHQYPQIELIKAFRVKDSETLRQAATYTEAVDTFLFDAYHPTELGGTGQTWNWSSLSDYTFCNPWFLAGGLNPKTVGEAIAAVQPPGIDVSSGVESAPGQKDLTKVEALLQALGRSGPFSLEH